MDTETSTRRTPVQRRTDASYRVRELSERPEFEEDVARKVRLYHNHPNAELSMELLAWESIYEESLNGSLLHTAKNALANIQAIGAVLTERGAW